ncbi:MAG: hypothetical protein WAR79_05295 [Melioribacteraceae bacterium]
MNRTLLSLAILKVNWENNNKDYIDNFVPLIGTLLYKNDNNDISLEKLQSNFLSEYGLKIPLNALKTILNRMTKNGFITKNYGKYLTNHQKLIDLDISKNAKKLSDDYNNLIKKLENYCSLKFEINFNLTELENAFIAFLKDFDFDILFLSGNGSTLPEIKESKKFKYIISSFIIEMNEKDPITFKLISDISIGYSLAQSILFTELNSYSGKLINLNFYLDTPFIFNLLGLNGEYKKRSSDELLNILNDEKANLFLLRTNFEEVETILNDCFTTLERGNYVIDKASRIIRYCHKNSISASDIQQKIIRLKDILKEYNIYNDRVPSYDSSKEYQIDEQLLNEIITNTYSKVITDINIVELESKGTIHRDIKVLGGMYKLREGTRPRNIKDAKHIFLTTNSSLAYASRIYDLKQNGNMHSIPVCLTDVFLGTIIWLQSPMKVESINQKKLIADCYSATQPNEKLIQKYIIEIEKSKKEMKISNDDYYLLRSDRAVLNLLEQFTLNDPDLFDNSTTEDILDRIIEGIKHEEHFKYENEKNLHEQTKIRADRLELDKEKIINKQNALLCKLSNLIGTIIFYFLIISFVTASVLSFLSTILGLNIIIIFLLWTIVFTFAFFNLYNGFNLKKSRKKTSDYICKLLNDFIKK